MSDSPVEMTQELPGSISQTEVMPEIRRSSFLLSVNICTSDLRVRTI